MNIESALNRTKPLETFRNSYSEHEKYSKKKKQKFMYHKWTRYEPKPVMCVPAIYNENQNKASLIYRGNAR